VRSSYVPVESLLSSSAFRRLFIISLAAHIGVFLALVLRPPSSATLIASAPVMVTMVDMPKPAAPAPPAAPPPAPKPPEEKPKPPPEPEPPPPPKPVVKEIVIPKEPAPLQKPKPVPQTPPPSADELIAKMTQRVEQQEAANAPPAPAATEAPANTQVALPSPGAFDPLFSPWIARVQVHVRSNWSGASVCEGKRMPVFNVDVDAGGHLTGIELSQSSGDSHCDDTGERALRKSDPLPAPPRPGQFELWLDAKVTP
jgi:outer membrane biosynthesis protein TonB